MNAISAFYGIEHQIVTREYWYGEGQTARDAINTNANITIYSIASADVQFKINKKVVVNALLVQRNRQSQNTLTHTRPVPSCILKIYYRDMTR